MARKLITWDLVTLDGYFEGPEKWSLDWHDLVWGDELETFSLEQAEAADTLLFGRVTYQGMAAYWRSADGAVADFMNGVTKVVFSGTLEEASWENTRLVSSDAAEEVARMKREPGRDILVFGSAELASSLLDRGLVDELRIGVVPLVLGQGTPFFKARETRLHMEHVGTRPLESGCVILSYRPIKQPRAVHGNG
jgi:dihydrofolate reductase